MKSTLVASLAIALLFILGVETVAVASTVGSQGSTTISKRDDCKGDKTDEDCGVVKRGFYF